MLNPNFNPKSVKKYPSSYVFSEDDNLLIRIGRNGVINKGIVVKCLNPVMFLVSVDGEVKKVHLNQMSHAPLSSSTPVSTPLVPSSVCPGPVVMPQPSFSQSIPMYPGLVRSSPLRSSPTQSSLPRPSLVHPSPVQFSPVCPSPTQTSPVRPSPTQTSLVRPWPVQSNPVSAPQLRRSKRIIHPPTKLNL